jgi:hypothetical protein
VETRGAVSERLLGFVAVRHSRRRLERGGQVLVRELAMSRVDLVGRLAESLGIDIEHDVACPTVDLMRTVVHDEGDRDGGGMNRGPPPKDVEVETDQ